MKYEMYSILYDYYGILLSERQREVFELYHEENYSFSEIGANLGISRQAAHRLLGKANSGLELFEQQLGLVAKHESYEKTLNEIETRTNAILKDKSLTASLDPDITKCLKRIKKLVKELDI